MERGDQAAARVGGRVSTRLGLAAITGAGALASLGLITPVAANAAAERECHRAHGVIKDVFVSPNEARGTWAHGGWFDGATDVLFTSFDPVTGAYTDDWTVTNSHGVLVGHDSGTLFPDGSAVEVGNADPAASTGRYAGATGTLTFRSNAPPSGTVCVPDE
jgi:hypothetical protein